MKKYIILVIVLIMSITPCWAIKLRPTSVVQDFISKVNVYVSDDDPGVHEQLLDMCETGFRASDQLTRELYSRKENSVQSNSYGLADFLLILQEAKGTLAISYIKERSNLHIQRTKNGITAVEIKTMINTISRAYSSMQKTTYHNLIYINKAGKIVGIGDYDEDTRKPTNTIELKGFTFNIQNTSGDYSERGVVKAHKGDISYLYCNVNVVLSRKQDVIFCSRIIKPNGTMDICSSCTNKLTGYTFTSEKLSIAAEPYTYSAGFGNKSGGYWEVGTYRWEIWTHEGLLGYKTFEILEPKPNIEISEVSFATNSSTGGDYGETLYVGDAHSMYLYSKIKCTSPIKYNTNIQIDIYTPQGELGGSYNEKISAGLTTFEIRCGDRYYSSGDYSYKIYEGGNRQKLIKTGTFNMRSGEGVRLSDRNVFFHRNKLNSRTIRVTNIYDKKFIKVTRPGGSQFIYRQKGNSIIISPKWYAERENKETWTITNKVNGAQKQLDVQQEKASESYYTFADYMDFHGLYRLDFGAPKMFAGPEMWGGELSLCDLRFTMAGLSVVNFGVKSTYDLTSYQIYYAPQVSCLIPVAEKEYGHALYISAGPTIELYSSTRSNFRPYWFTAEIGYRLSLYISEYDFFVKYVDGLAFGMAVRFGLDWEEL